MGGGRRAFPGTTRKGRRASLLCDSFWKNITQVPASLFFHCPWLNSCLPRNLPISGHINGMCMHVICDCGSCSGAGIVLHQVTLWGGANKSGVVPKLQSQGCSCACKGQSRAGAVELPPAKIPAWQQQEFQCGTASPEPHLSSAAWEPSPGAWACPDVLFTLVPAGTNVSSVGGTEEFSRLAPAQWLKRAEDAAGNRHTKLQGHLGASPKATQ